MEFLQLAKDRYSCRQISTKKVDRKLIEKILDAGIAAPTAVNRQPYKLFLMESDEAKANVKKTMAPKFGTADAFIVVGYEEDGDGWVREYDGEKFAPVDATIVATHIMLEVQDLGLATTWVGHFNAPMLKEMYPEMAKYGLIAIFPIGYAADDAKPADRHFERRSREEAVKTL